LLQLDGSLGEGGGQILRTALALSAVTGVPFELTNIRSNRPRPGLRPQHLESVKACARLCGARVTGAAENSPALRFEPGLVQPGRYRFEIRTAGSAGLLLQAAYLPLVFSGAESRLEIRGGTHVPWSPCYHFLERQWARWLRRIGIEVRLGLKRAGFYPQGGGEMQAAIRPAAGLLPLRCTEAGALRDLGVLSAACNLPEHIAERQKKRALERLREYGIEPRVEAPKNLPAQGKGSFLLLTAEFEGGAGCYSSLGAIGKPAEKVADEAAKSLAAFIGSGAVMDEYLADQILVPLSLIPAESEYTTPCITAHLLTNAEIIRRFVPAEIRIEGEPGKPGRVVVTGSDPRRLEPAS
jgi:RNA 3'-terminal phosphate cyclase (ATP)